jgi:hypothetical protein
MTAFPGSGWLAGNHCTAPLPRDDDDDDDDRHQLQQ